MSTGEREVPRDAELALRLGLGGFLLAGPGGFLLGAFLGPHAVDPAAFGALSWLAACATLLGGATSAARRRAGAGAPVPTWLATTIGLGAAWTGVGIPLTLLALLAPGSWGSGIAAILLDMMLLITVLAYLVENEGSRADLRTSLGASDDAALLRMAALLAGGLLAGAIIGGGLAAAAGRSARSELHRTEVLAARATSDLSDFGCRITAPCRERARYRELDFRFRVGETIVSGRTRLAGSIDPEAGLIACVAPGIPWLFELRAAASDCGAD